MVDGSSDIGRSDNCSGSASVIGTIPHSLLSVTMLVVVLVEGIVWSGAELLPDEKTEAIECSCQYCHLIMSFIESPAPLTLRRTVRMIAGGEPCGRSNLGSHVDYGSGGPG